MRLCLYAFLPAIFAAAGSVGAMYFYETFENTWDFMSYDYVDYTMHGAGAFLGGYIGGYLSNRITKKNYKQVKWKYNY